METNAELGDEQVRLVSVLDTDPSTNTLHVSRRHVYDLPIESANIPEKTYVALSYSWGSERSIVNCDDEVLTISSNLVPALHRLKQHFPDSLFWTDSISINQFHGGEKAHQVSMMGRIFATAESVVVWFGDGTEDIFQGLETLTSETHSPDMKDASKARIDLLRRLSQISWFFRAWTFQEIRLARKAFVMLGRELLPWRTFIDKIQRLRSLEPNVSTVQIRSTPISYSQFTYQPKDRFFAILDELNSGTSSDLAGLLFLTWYRDATEKRDKVYSLLSSALFSNQNHGIGIDYEIPWNDLCIKAARAAINTGSSLKILKIAGMMTRWKDGLTNKWDPGEMQQLIEYPSWVPNWWTPPQQTRSHPSLVFDERNCFSDLSFCCPDIPPIQSIDDTSRVLVLKGVVLGIINVGDEPTYPGGAILVHAPPYCASTFTEGFIEKPKSTHSRSPSLQGVARVHIPMFMKDVYKHLHGNCICVPYDQRPEHKGFNAAISVPSIQSHRPPPLNFERHTFFSLSHQRADPTPSTVGQDPEMSVPAQVLATSVESGDWLVLLEGGGMPFVLRPAIDRFGMAKEVGFVTSPEERRQFNIPHDAGLFVLVGEASLCWDKLWPHAWDMYCKAGTFAII